MAFFELPTKPAMGRDENTPIWTQHLALKVDGEETLNATKHKLIDAGLEVLGSVNHTLFKSIYFLTQMVIVLSLPAISQPIINIVKLKILRQRCKLPWMIGR